MDDYKIRLGHTDSVDSVDRENFLDVRIQNTSKELHFSDVKKTIDQYELFQQEREKCNRYRLILTINPFCSNVLFNPFTEIVKYGETNNNCERYIDNGDLSEAPPRDIVNGIDGDETPKRIQMISNTEFSKPENGYIYLPGFDMFDNHILRNKSFKVVQKNGPEDVRNTLADTLRDSLGIVKKMWVRLNGLYEQPVQQQMHLYGYDEVLSFEESVNSNLYEENGWFGFVNHSNLVTNSGEGIERVLNNKEACEFVDMYPNRQLFSFNPSYNERFDRLEYNWDIALTYPYENDYDNFIVEGNGVNGLKVLTVDIAFSPSGEPVAVLRSFVKHNLKRNESIILWYADNRVPAGGDDDDDEHNESDVVGEYTPYDSLIRVKNIGNFSNDDEDYFFYVDGEEVFSILIITPHDISMAVVNLVTIGRANIEMTSQIIDILLDYGSDKLTPIELYNLLKTHYDVDLVFMLIRTILINTFAFRFKRVVNGVGSQYYVRKFKKLPNFKKRKRDVIENDLLNRNTFEEYENGDGNAVYDFDKEFYKLGFATTIYGDECSQITYTDTIDLENLTDNLGRPLSEIFVTVIKRNKGNKIWYTNTEKNKIFGQEVEQSHCFGEVTSGFEIGNRKKDEEDIVRSRGRMGDVKILNNSENTGLYIRSYAKALEKDVTIDQNYFYGDVVEFAPYEFKEYVLSDVNYRFNTYQREHPLRVLGSTEKIPFVYHEIAGDDYDYPENQGNNNVAFKIEKFVVGDTEPTKPKQSRDEGYYYKSHYGIKLREFGDLQQDSHQDLMIRNVAPAQKGKMMLKIKTKLPHKLNCGDKVMVFDDENGVYFNFACVYIENKITFYIIPYVPNGIDTDEWVYLNNDSLRFYTEGLTWLSVTEYLRDGVFCLRKENTVIPSYAVRAGINTYLWRDLLSVNEAGSGELPEFTYTNNAFYVSKIIDFFLKRQDPDGNIGLYAKNAFPNDIIGKIKKDSIYKYKEEIVPVC